MVPILSFVASMGVGILPWERRGPAVIHEMGWAALQVACRCFASLVLLSAGSLVLFLQLSRLASLFVLSHSSSACASTGAGLHIRRSVLPYTLISHPIPIRWSVFQLLGHFSFTSLSNELFSSPPFSSHSTFLTPSRYDVRASQHDTRRLSRCPWL